MPLDATAGGRLERLVTVVDAAPVFLLDLLAEFVVVVTTLVLPAVVLGPVLIISVEELVEAPLDLVLQLVEESVHLEGGAKAESRRQHRVKATGVKVQCVSSGRGGGNGAAQVGDARAVVKRRGIARKS